MALPRPGLYHIQLNQDLLTLLDNLLEGPVNIMEPTGNPGEQEWHLQTEGGNSITLRNLKYGGMFAGVKGEPRAMAPVVAIPEPFEFKLNAADEPHHYYIYVDSSDGPLYVNYSPLKIFPPRTALSPVAEKPWLFQFME